jgi:hypothetical protein
MAVLFLIHIVKHLFSFLHRGLFIVKNLEDCWEKNLEFPKWEENSDNVPLQVLEFTWNRSSNKDLLQGILMRMQIQHLIQKYKDGT